MALFSRKSWNDWVTEYAQSHQHPVNRRCHQFGIPLIVVSLALLPLAWWQPGVLWLSAGLFVLGWILQFVGHYYEGKPPEFFRDWRFLFVGVRWWLKEHARK